MSDAPLPCICFAPVPGRDASLLPPRRASAGAAGYDIRANCRDEIVIEPGEIAVIPTGFALEIPENVEAQIRPRSGLAIKFGLGVVNSPGTIDSDYRGEVMVALINHGKEPARITHGMRIAQMVFAPVLHFEWQLGAPGESERGAGGFGSTGSS